MSRSQKKAYMSRSQKSTYKSVSATYKDLGLLHIDKYITSFIGTCIHQHMNMGWLQNKEKLTKFDKYKIYQ
jgi:hypothetical protein